MSGMMSICIVQPMDLIKTRLQLLGAAGRNVTTVQMTREVVRKQGLRGLYAGLTAALLRQATYTTGRLGCFTYLLDVYTASYGTASFGVKMMLGVVAGSVGALVGNPAEVALVRMTSDARLPPNQRRNYKNVFNAISRMVKEEGLSSLLRGASATIARSAALNSVSLASYAQAHESLIYVISPGLPLHFCSAMIAGVTSTFASLPFDKVKTKVQTAKKGGIKTSMPRLVVSIVKKEGPVGLWSGFLANYLKAGPHNVFVFLFLEQINAFYLSRV